MPMAGVGTWQYNSSTAYDAVRTALRLGVTHIDTALVYENQMSVGKAIADSGVDRSKLFIVSKVMGGTNFSATTDAVNLCLEQLGLEYVDLMFMHFPSDAEGKGGPEMRKLSWTALEVLHKAGKARAIGVSHYCKRQMEDVLEIATVKPAVNQVEFHLGMGTTSDEGNDYRAFDKENGILYQSFSPLCGPCGPKAHMELIAGEVVTGIGAKYNKTGAQVSLKWIVQQGIPVIPKSDNPKHILANMDLFDWELSAEDMATLTAKTYPPVSGGGDGKTSGDCGIP
ncbi:hypothetical protein CYMTET_48969 [Cymbomonas tetramitiformis]|uniref:NADP-dependent oxidoreductase domain-containing protein n=1 Tax=Cymbomonas tetramitiformis TaxID=36881 RepID=A0AAE0BR95_9CHLO|nr:hypothetical protein CYMTET_48969 [Cymbomonas tetramitiformis]